jgi:hypothetical protein
MTSEARPLIVDMLGLDRNSTSPRAYEGVKTAMRKPAPPETVASGRTLD